MLITICYQGKAPIRKEYLLKFNLMDSYELEYKIN